MTATFSAQLVLMQRPILSPVCPGDIISGRKYYLDLSDNYDNKLHDPIDNGSYHYFLDNHHFVEHFVCPKQYSDWGAVYHHFVSGSSDQYPGFPSLHWIQRRLVLPDWLRYQRDQAISGKPTGKPDSAGMDC